MHPLNDLAKIELAELSKFDPGDTSNQAENGILVELPDRFTFFGFWSFAFENSLMNQQVLEDLYEYWKGYIGKRVYWSAMSERGNILKSGDRFAYVKLTSLIAWSEPDDVAENLHSGNGQYRV